MLSIKFKRGTSAQNDALTENAGVLTLDTENFQIRMHDGVTVGGHAINTIAGITAIANNIDALGIADVDGLDAALAAKIALTEMGAANGIATLNPEGVVPTEQLPSYVEDIIEVADFASLPGTGEIGKLYVLLDTNELYRWSGGQSQYYRITAELSGTDDLSEGQVNLYFTEARVREAISVTGDLSYDPQTGVLTYSSSVSSVAGKTGDVVVDKADVGLDQVQNYGMASDPEAQAAVASDKYMAPSNARALVLAMGFTDAEGSWKFEGLTLPFGGLQGNFTTLPNLPSDFSDVSYRRDFVTTIGGKIYAMGRSGLHIYDVASEQWSEVSDATAVYSDGSNYQVATDGNDLFVMTESGNLWRYNVAVSSWDYLSQSTTDHTYGSLVYYNDKLYSYGGINDGSSVNYLSSYDIAANNWTTEANLTEINPPLQGHALFQHEGNIYIAGGEDQWGDEKATMWRYNIATKVVTQMANAPDPFARAGGAIIGDKIYVYGGWASTSTRNRLREYDIATDTWTLIANGPVINEQGGVAAHEESLYLISGANNSLSFVKVD